MSTRLADRLQAARQRRFAGRQAELDLLRSAITAPDLPFAVLYIYGPGGIGKTTLLAEFAQAAAALDVRTIALDARSIDPSPMGIAVALQPALNIGEDRPVTEYLASYPGRLLLTLDTYELLAPLDTWLRDDLLPQLTADTLVVIAGREPPPLAWRTDLGWQHLFRAVALRNLSIADSDDYLGRSGVPSDQRQRVLDFTHGHPLALSLAADLFAQRPDISFQPEEAPDMIKTLLELFVQKVPGPAHRAVLEICALVNLTTEPLLAAMLDLPEAHDLFDWLRGLSLIASMRQGVFPHDLAREALTADLRWRNPLWYKELHRRAREYYSAQLHKTSAAEQQAILHDYIYLHRTNPVVRPFYEWQQGFSLVAEPARPDDIPTLLAMIEHHEGHESAEHAARWFATQLDQVLVVREVGATSNRAIAGVLVKVALERATRAEREADPAIERAWAFLQQHAPLRHGQRATHFRFWLARDGYQSVTAVQTALMVQIVHHYLITPQLAYTFFPVSDPEFWAPLAAYADLTHHPEAAFRSGSYTFGVFGHDWRATPPSAWLGLLAEREVASDALAIRPVPSVASQPLVLSESDFRRAVEEAVHHYVRLDRLYNSSLVRAQVVVSRAGAEATIAERISILQQIIREACDVLQASPRDLRLYRAVYHTYLQPAATQERVAEILDLPFSTYRRHLKQGMQRIAELLWQLELNSTN